MNIVRSLIFAYLMDVLIILIYIFLTNEFLNNFKCFLITRIFSSMEWLFIDFATLFAGLFGYLSWWFVVSFYIYRHQCIFKHVLQITSANTWLVFPLSLSWLWWTEILSSIVIKFISPTILVTSVFLKDISLPWDFKHIFPHFLQTVLKFCFHIKSLIHLELIFCALFTVKILCHFFGMEKINCPRTVIEHSFLLSSS